MPIPIEAGFSDLFLAFFSVSEFTAVSLVDIDAFTIYEIKNNGLPQRSTSWTAAFGFPPLSLG
jgi:hypothetical protein